VLCWIAAAASPSHRPPRHACAANPATLCDGGFESGGFESGGFFGGLVCAYLCLCEWVVGIPLFEEAVRVAVRKPSFIPVLLRMVWAIEGGWGEDEEEGGWMHDEKATSRSHKPTL
jgi:hypothetical protein